MKSILLILVLSLTTVMTAMAQETPNTYGEPVQDETPAAQPESSGVDNAKLDEILSGQSQILQKLDEIQQELAIVKVRATQNT